MCRRVFLVGLTMPILAITSARAQGSAAPTQPGRAPFQLTWGMSVKNIRDLVRPPPQEVSPFFELHSSQTDGTYLRLRRDYDWLPHTPDDTERVTLYFGYRDELFQVYAHGETRSADYATNRYKELSSLLSEFYGPGQETLAARSWFRKPDLESVLRQTSFNTSEVQVTLSLLSGDNDAAYWSIGYWNRAGVAKFQADHLKLQKDAL